MINDRVRYRRGKRIRKKREDGWVRRGKGEHANAGEGLLRELGLVREMSA